MRQDPVPDPIRCTGCSRPLNCLYHPRSRKNSRCTAVRWSVIGQCWYEYGANYNHRRKLTCLCGLVYPRSFFKIDGKRHNTLFFLSDEARMENVL